jgi:hypothetical protein
MQSNLNDHLGQQEKFRTQRLINGAYHKLALTFVRTSLGISAPAPTPPVAGLLVPRTGAGLEDMLNSGRPDIFSSRSPVFIY